MSFRVSFAGGTAGVACSGAYRTHDFRRGHAKDLQLSGMSYACSCCVHCCYYQRNGFVVPGAPLWQILEAGQWRSPAFLSYLDMHSLEKDLVVQAHCDESDEEDVVAAQLLQ